MHISPCRMHDFRFVHSELHLRRKNICLCPAPTSFIPLLRHIRIVGPDALAARTAFHPSDPSRPDRATGEVCCSVGRIATFHHSFGSIIVANRLLSPERAALGKTGLATGGLAEDLGAAGADDDSLGVGEDSGDGEAAGALDVHEEGAGARHKGLAVMLDLCDWGWRFRRGVCTFSLCLRASC